MTDSMHARGRGKGRSGKGGRSVAPQDDGRPPSGGEGGVGAAGAEPPVPHVQVSRGTDLLTAGAALVGLDVPAHVQGQGSVFQPQAAVRAV
jgi:hypothetical protein